MAKASVHARPFAALAALTLALTPGCDRPPVQIRGDAGLGGGGSTGDTDASFDGDPAAYHLLGAPLIFAPTASGFGLSVVLRAGDPSALRARVRAEGAGAWTAVGAPASPAQDVAQWTVDGLAPGRRYDYEVCVTADCTVRSLYAGTVITQRARGDSFTFAAMADSHIPPRDPILPGTDVGTDVMSGQESTFLAVNEDVRSNGADFLLNLGDLLDYHLFGFNTPPPTSGWSRLAYLNYRRLFARVTGNVAHFSVVGNWDGENGCNSDEEIGRSLSQRMLYLPGPAPDTYPEGGGPNEDYYAFTWGDALFVVLNVMTYTPTCHLLGQQPGVADDWTLGATQLAWLDRTLAQATSKWRFLFIHHTVGGAAGNDVDSAYGRGGGQAAHVGEQAAIHELMRRRGVQVFFYAHDHVFTDMVVDGIHYTLPGSAGAPWKFTEFETGYTSYFPDSGFARVRVTPARVQVDFVAMGGTVLQSYALE